MERAVTGNFIARREYRARVLKGGRQLRVRPGRFAASGVHPSSERRIGPMVG